VPVSFARSLSLSVSRARFASAELLPPHVLLLSLYAVGLSCQFRLLHARRGLARAHPRTSPGFSATTPAHAPNSLFRAPLVPRTRPSPHFAHPHPLSRSALAARRHRRPASAFPTIQLAGDRTKPPRAPPRGETPVPVPNSLIAPCVRPILPSLMLDRGDPPCSHGGRPI
jgi:hypothetical protein